MLIFVHVKKIAAIFLLFAITFQVCSKLVVAGWFSIHRQELTALFCVNKQDPASNCRGACYLNKKLKETDQDNQQGTTLPVKHKTVTEEVWFCERETALTAPASNTQKLLAATHNHYSFQYGISIFQPPRA